MLASCTSSSDKDVEAFKRELSENPKCKEELANLSLSRCEKSEYQAGEKISCTAGGLNFIFGRTNGKPYFLKQEEKGDGRILYFCGNVPENFMEATQTALRSTPNNSL